MALSPRSTSKSTITAVESCSSPKPKEDGVKGYYFAHPNTDPWVPATVYGTFPPMDPYIYCQNDPSYKEEAATAVFVVMYLIDSATGVQGQAQLGLRKYRTGGQTQINKAVYFELSYYPIKRYPQDRQHYFIGDIAPMPSSNTVLTVSRDCTSGILAALVGGTNMIPSVGGSSNQIDPSLWNAMVAMKGFAVAAAVELHDIRSHGPGTNSNPYIVGSAQFTKCSGGSDKICNGTGGTLSGNPPPELNISTTTFTHTDFKTWDTRN